MGMFWYIKKSISAVYLPVFAVFLLASDSGRQVVVSIVALGSLSLH
jgi:hypothetical protein